MRKKKKHRPVYRKGRKWERKGKEQEAGNPKEEKTED